MKWFLVALVVLCTALADYLQTTGMKRHGEIHDFRPGALGRVASALARNWYIPAAVATMAVSFYAFITLLSIADLSFAVPATAANYIAETLVARYLLKEKVNAKRWTGAGLVACGVLLLAL